MLKIFKQPKTENDKKHEVVLSAINSERLVLENVQKNIELLKKEEQNYVQNNKGLSEDIVENANRLESIKKDISDKELLLSKVNSDLNIINKNNEEEKKRLEKEIETLNNKVSELEKEADSILHDADEESDIIIEEALIQFSEVNEEIEKLENNRDNLLIELTELNNDKQELIKQKETFERLNNSYLAEHNTQSNINKSLKEENTQLLKNNNRAEEIIAEKEKRIKEIDLVLSTKEEQLKELEDKKVEIVKGSIALTDKQEFLREKEMYIKQQYEIAGLTYKSYN